MPVVSVIIPTYNRRSTLWRSVESVLNQTFDDIEIIVVDDGSCDGTELLFAELSDERIKYYKLHHLGACAARNFGISKSKGKYVAFQDSDDVWFPDKLERQLEYLSVTNADVVSCIFDMDGLEFKHHWDGLPSSKHLELRDFFPQNYVGTPCILFKRDVLLDEQFKVSQQRLQDWELMIRVVVKYKVYLETVPRVLCCMSGVRISSDSAKLRSGLVGIMQTISELKISKSEKREYLRQIILQLGGRKRKTYFSMFSCLLVFPIPNRVITKVALALLPKSDCHV